MKKIIVLTGPESTAKSTLSKQLADHFQGTRFPEYARSYLEGKSSAYCYHDVETIAKGQIQQYENALVSEGEFVFLDTWLIVTMVWFEWAYGKKPAWLQNALIDYPIHLYLLCKPDIPWEPDPLREHGGEERQKLYNVYRQELLELGLPFVEVEGEGESRLQAAIEAIINFSF
ncbi:AAA family ATPase [Mangrovibacterium sp.]|uniref:AAA family ATPase n=1 Tax=Mangrovibacterium sp. TaxID=1961364 RepID=UPI003564C661